MATASGVKWFSRGVAQIWKKTKGRTAVTPVQPLVAALAAS
jgi:hypothetical protein